MRSLLCEKSSNLIAMLRVSTCWPNVLMGEAQESEIRKEELELRKQGISNMSRV